jgi:hypothetical protein
MMKLCIVLLALVVMGGAWRVEQRRQNSLFGKDSAIQYRATRKLVPNHRIVAADLALPPGLPDDLYWRLPERSALEGHYVDGVNVQRGDPVETTKVASIPGPMLNEPCKRSFVYSLESKPELAQLLDPGTKATIEQTEVEVGAVICPQGSDPAKPPPCYAVLTVPEDKADGLWKANPVPPLVPRSF